MRTVPIVVLAILACAPPASPQDWPPPEERLLDWTDLQFPPAEYQARRVRMMDRLRAEGGGVLLVPSGDGATEGATFRQSDGFNYFVGLELPASILALDVESGRSVLFLPERDARFENPARRNDFPGRPLGDDPAVVSRTGVDETRSISQVNAALEQWSRRGVTVWIDGGVPGDLVPTGPALTGGLAPEQALLQALTRDHPGLRVVNAHQDVARLRMVKSPVEIDAMAAAAAATAEAIRRAARFVASGVDERSLEGEFELGCKRQGAQRLAFASIVKSGENSLWPWRVLAAQYDRRNRSMSEGELVIFDVGCELDYYSSDVGRTFPVSGRFTARQREILRMVTGVADAVIAEIRPGVTLPELTEVAAAVIPDSERRHMQTGTFFGHHVGLSVGDPALLEVPLEPGMVFTVEPWYYNHEEGLAVFVEDEILVTEDGARVLTDGLPREPEALERLVGAVH